MPPTPKLCRPKGFQDTASITSAFYLDFLAPASSTRPPPGKSVSAKRQHHTSGRGGDLRRIESFFFCAVSYAASCRAHRYPILQRPQHGLCHQSFTTTSNAGRRSSIQEGQYRKNANRINLERLGQTVSARRSSPPDERPSEETANAVKESRRHTGGLSKSRRFFQPNFADGSRLPQQFYEDVALLQDALTSIEVTEIPDQDRTSRENSDEPTTSLEDQLKLVKSIRELEDKLAKAKSALHKSLEVRVAGIAETKVRTDSADHNLPSVVLTKEDYLNLVDLYFYSHQTRFTPDSPDHSPTPLFLDEYSFKLSADFSKPSPQPREERYEANYTSPLKHVEEMLKSRQIREISVMQGFVSLLLDDNSSNQALFEVYKEFPTPGVGFLPPGIIRLFLQRMSTPTAKSEKNMLRYLSLIDDMQAARLPITSAEWSSAIYLAGRSFAQVTEREVAASFRIWREMEHEAGVRSNHVTFNILFDIAVRAGKYVLGETVLKEMHDRGLRLNRLGRVSLIYYHGLRGDGDGVRKAYRDFVESGEIVDTLVLNCVMASLINAQEPVAAEQVYERMKTLQTRLQKGRRRDGDEALFMQYPPPGSNQINMEMASNSLGRILLRAANLRNVLPEHHETLQNMMPLTPDIITFRTMIAHHASTSGDLDRLTVLMNDMTDLFELPLTTITFQLLFKGFAIHGASRSQDNKWTLKRLEMVWNACREAIKTSTVSSTSLKTVSLPTIQEVDAATLAEDQAQALLPPRTKSRPAPKLGAWDEFVLDLAAFPRERMKPIHERKAPIGIDDADEFTSPFFQNESETNTTSPSPSSPTDTPDTDFEDDEYHLPAINAQAGMSPTNAEPEPLPTSSSNNVRRSPSAPDPRIRPTRSLIIWLIRAYQRVTNSRRKVEEVWFQVRKIWRPADMNERDAMVRVLRRALRDCDRMAGR